MHVCVCVCMCVCHSIHTCAHTLMHARIHQPPTDANKSPPAHSFWRASMKIWSPRHHQDWRSCGRWSRTSPWQRTSKARQRRPARPCGPRRWLTTPRWMWFASHPPPWTPRRSVDAFFMVALSVRPGGSSSSIQYLSNFNILKADTFSAGLFWCFRNPLNSDRDYRILNVRMWSFCTHTHAGDLGLSSHPKDFCRVCTEFDSRVSANPII